MSIDLAQEILAIKQEASDFKRVDQMELSKNTANKFNDSSVENIQTDMSKSPHVTDTLQQEDANMDDEESNCTIQTLSTGNELSIAQVRNLAVRKFID
jgi:hypothetical protein